MEKKEEFDCYIEKIKAFSSGRHTLVDPEVLLWAGEKIERLEKEIEECRQIRANGIDRNKDHKDTLKILCAVAVNGVYWRNESIKRLHEENDELWELINTAADKAMEANNNWITLREILKVSRESKE